MKKKEIKISNEEMMELMGLKRTSNSDDNSDKTAGKSSVSCPLKPSDSAPLC